jgi:hypothetical protein
MHSITLADFSDLIHHDFPVITHAGRIVMTLTAATPLPGGIPGGRQPFSLKFRGPVQPLLPQSMYSFEHPAHGTLDIFIVPVAADRDGLMYEAVFG